MVSGFLQNSQRKSVGKVIFVDDDLGLHLRVIRISQDMSDTALRSHPLGRISRNLSHNNLIRSSPLGLSLRNKEFLNNSFVLRDDVGIILSPHKLSHNLVTSPFQNPDDRSFPSFLTDGFHPGHHSVSMHGLPEISRTNEYILLPFPFRNDEAISVRMAFDPAHDEIHLDGQAVTIPADLDNLPLVRQVPEYLPNPLPLVLC